jgi:hypothetical protein
MNVKLVRESLYEYSNPWVKTDKGGKALLDYEAKVLDVLIDAMGEDEAFASMEIPFVGEMLAKAAQRRKSPERFAMQVMKIADDEWTRNGWKESVQENLNEGDDRNYDDFELDVAEEFYRAGKSHMEITKMMDDVDFKYDMMDHYKDGMNGMEYASMLLNKWSEVPRHEIKENLNESQDILSIRDLAQIGSRTQHVESQKMAERVFLKMYIKAYKNAGDEEVQELFRKQTDLNLEVMSRGKYMIV